MAVTKNPKNLAEEKLKESGLTLKDAETLRIEVLGPKGTQALHESLQLRPSLKFNYMDPRVKKPTPLRPWQGWPAFYRVRYLGQGKEFADLTKKPRRYAQEPESGACAYFPSGFVPWPKVVADPDVPLLVTEGELKAAKACKEGFPTIGLGGVYSFRSSRLGITFLDELDGVRWAKRNVYIVYDSDLRTNEQVCSALNALATELTARGAVPHQVYLPDLLGDGKTGLDDFLVARSGEALSDLLHRAQPLTLAERLWKLNEEVVYVREPGLVVVQGTEQKLSPSAFKEHAYAALDYAEQVVKPDGSISLKPVSAAGAWLRWPLRREARRLTYAPGEDRFTGGEGDLPAYNTWPGWGIEPKKGTVKPFMKLLGHLFKDAPKEDLEWFLRWCAWPLQHPGTKLFTASVLYGRRHGTGKSLVGYTLGRIYGKNFTEICQAELHGNFNEWAEDKQFVLGDDVTGSDKRQDADMLKRLITQLEMRINVKYIPSYVVPDCVNFLFTSNHPDAFFLEDDDRRYFVHEVTGGPLDDDFYEGYMRWLDKEGGSAALFHHLLNLDTGDFNPAAQARKTLARDLMIADAKSDLGDWVRRLLADPDAMLVVGEAKVPGDLFTNRQLLDLYDPTSRTGVTANGLGRELRRAGAAQACRGNSVRWSGGQDRFYALRNPERWVRANPRTAKSHLEGPAKPAPKKPPKY